MARAARPLEQGIHSPRSLVLISDPSHLVCFCHFCEVMCDVFVYGADVCTHVVVWHTALIVSLLPSCAASGFMRLRNIRNAEEHVSRSLRV